MEDFKMNETTGLECTINGNFHDCQVMTTVLVRRKHHMQSFLSGFSQSEISGFSRSDLSDFSRSDLSDFSHSDFIAIVRNHVCLLLLAPTRSDSSILETINPSRQW